MHRYIVGSLVRRRLDAGFHTSASRAAITKFTLPALSPTMTEGSIHKWMKKEGESFAAGDVLLELETDKAQMDVEAQDDGVLAKIILPEGEKAAVNSTIALLAEEGDDISNVEFKEEEQKASPSPSTSTESKDTSTATTPPSASSSSPMDHHELDTSKLKKPLSPAVLNLVLKHSIKNLDQIKASGPGGRILKGDVLAHIGQIEYKPAPKPTTSAAPPRDQIVIAQPGKDASKKPQEQKTVPPTFISKQVTVDKLLQLRRGLNDEHQTSVSVNDWIGRAAALALQDVAKPVVRQQENTGVICQSALSPSAFTETYKGGSFKVFHLAKPSYDFITDSYEPAKPYVLKVSESRRLVDTKRSQKSANDDMVDLIGYLGGEVSPKTPAHPVRLSTEDARLDFEQLPACKDNHFVQLKLEGGAPGKILNDPKSAVFLDRLEHYIKNPEELVA